MPSIPSVFLSHGAPTIALADCPVREFWRGLIAEIGRPDAVLCVSAHWETSTPTVSTVERPETIHDFYGFPAPLYDLIYSPPGAPDLAGRARLLLSDAALPCETDGERGLDHGAWIPLMEMLPDADIPVAQISIQADRDIAHHIAVGRALTPLRHDGVLVLASGGAVHNLGAFSLGSDEVPDWAVRFDDWLAETLEQGDGEALNNYRTEDGAIAHPRDEHLLPLGVALGAGGDGAKGRALHRGFMDGALSTSAFAFG